MSAFDKVMSRVLQSDGGCLVWPGAKNSGGYGQVLVAGKMLYTHRVTAAHRFGPIPDGMQVDHLCRNRACCNPDHLEIVTRQENIRRGECGIAHKRKWAAVTHCSKGHAYTPDNTYRLPNGKRDCRLCRKDIKARFRARLREAAL